MYRPFHKTLPRSSVFVNWLSVRFYETDCILHIIFRYFLLHLIKTHQTWLKSVFFHPNSCTRGPRAKALSVARPEMKTFYRFIYSFAHSFTLESFTKIALTKLKFNLDNISMTYVHLFY